MPRTSNDIDYVKWKDPRTKKSKQPPPEPWAVPPFTPFRIDNYWDLGEGAVPQGTDRGDPLALFRLFFTDEMLDKMAGWTNAYAEAHPVSEEEAPKGRARPWKPTCRQELYAYFGVVIHMGITIEPAVEDYWGPIEKGAAHKVTEYISRNRFEQLERYIRCSPMPEDGFHTTFDRVDELSEHLRVLCRKFWRPGPHLAVDETIQRFMGRAPEIVNIPSKPTPEGFKIWVLANQSYVLDWLWHAKGDKKGPVNLNKAFLNEGFTKTQAVVLDLLTQRNDVTNERLYPPGKHVVWLDNLFSSVKLFERLRELGIGAAGTVRTTRTRREELGEEEYNVQEETIEVNRAAPAKSKLSTAHTAPLKQRTERKKKVPAERFSASLSDLKLSHDTQIPWGTLYAELSKSHQVMEFAWKDATMVLFLSTVHDGRCLFLNTVSQSR